jgi:hypothetical protein
MGGFIFAEIYRRFCGCLKITDFLVLEIYALMVANADLSAGAV